MIRNKTIKFNLDKEEDRELWEWLSSRPHGEFTDETKYYWKHRMNKFKTGEPKSEFTTHYQQTNEIVTITEKQLEDKFGIYDFSQEHVIRFPEITKSDDLLKLIGPSKTIPSAYDYYFAKV